MGVCKVSGDFDREARGTAGLGNVKAPSIIMKAPEVTNLIAIKSM